ncbi:MAG: hypothetical protein ACPGLV_12465 [Bacteroidia bacterium]
MEKIKPSIEGEFKFSLDKYPYLKEQQINQASAQFIKSQYPSKFNHTKEKIEFSNGLFRLKVNRGRNILRAFDKGVVTTQVNNKHLIVSYKGTLKRGLAISALHTLIVIIVFAFAVPTGIYFSPLFFILNYFLQIYLTHLVFPMNFGKALHEKLIELKDENS